MKLRLTDLEGNVVAERDLDNDVHADDEIERGAAVIEYESRMFVYDDTGGSYVDYIEARVTPYRTVVKQPSTEEAIYGRTIG